MRNGLTAIVMALFLGVSPVEPADGWQESKGPVGSPAYDFTLTQSGDVLVAVAEGVYRLDKPSSTWRPTGLVDREVQALMTASNGTLYAGGDGVWTSTDNGATWLDSGDGLSGPGTYIHDFAEADGTILVATDWGLYARGPGETRWAGNPGFSGSTRAVCVDDEGSILVGVGQWVIRSIDNGESWSEILTLNSFVTSIATAPEGLVLVGSADNGVPIWNWRQGKAHLSTDGGASFTRIDLDTGESSLRVNEVRSVAIVADSVLLVGGHRGDAADGEGGGVWFSEDLGASWQQNFYTGIDVLSIAELGDGEQWVGTEEGPVRPYQGSGIGVEWVAAGLKARNASVQGLVWSDLGLFAWSEGLPMQWWDTSGDSWVDIGMPANTIRGVSVGWSGSFLATAFGGLYSMASIPPMSWRHDLTTTDWEVDGFRPTMAAESDYKVCAADAATLRCMLYPHWTRIRFDSSTIAALSSHPSRQAFAALAPDEAGVQARIIRSPDGFESLEEVWSGEAAVRPGTLIVDDAGRFYAVLDDGRVLVSDENGEQWEQRGTLLPAPSMLVVSENSILYSAFSNQVMNSEDGGWTWKSYGKPIPGVEITSIAAGGGDLFVGTSTRGVFRSLVAKKPLRATSRTSP